MGAKNCKLFSSNQDDGVKIDMEEKSVQEGGDETKLLHTEESIPNAENDYVLVYERCSEEEDKDEESKEAAEDLVGMRTKFEKSLKEAGLIINRYSEEHATRHVVSHCPSLDLKL